MVATATIPMASTRIRRRRRDESLLAVVLVAVMLPLRDRERQPKTQKGSSGSSAYCTVYSNHTRLILHVMLADAAAAAADHVVRYCTVIRALLMQDQGEV